MKLLLDTHIWLWGLLEPWRLGPRVAAELENPENELWVSPVSTWEILLLVDRGRVVLTGQAAAWIRHVLETLPFREAALTHEVALRTRAIDLPHRDPVEAFLAATAAVYGLTLVTADAHLLHAGGFASLPNQ